MGKSKKQRRSRKHQKPLIEDALDLIIYLAVFVFFVIIGTTKGVFKVIKYARKKE